MPIIAKLKMISSFACFSHIERLNINLYNKTQEPLRKCEGHETAGGYFQSTPRSSSLGEMYVKEAGVFYLYNKTQEPCFYRVTREVAKDTRKA